MTALVRAFRFVRSQLDLAALALPWRRVSVFMASSAIETDRFEDAADPVGVADVRGRPMASPWEQIDVVGPVQVEALFRLLVSDRSLSPWTSKQRSGRSCLYGVSPALVAALLAIHLESREIDQIEPAVKGSREQG